MKSDTGLMSDIVYSGGATIDPSVPYRLPLKGLQHGQLFFIEGYTPKTAQKFTIDFVHDGGAQKEIALHINPRFWSREVIRNSLLATLWSEEEKDGVLPLNPGEGFQCCILVHSNHFKISFNGVHFTTYEHRMPKEEVNQLKIQGDLTLQLVKVTPGPSEKPAIRPRALPAIEYPQKPDTDEANDFKFLPGGYNLTTPPTSQSDTALHFDVRYWNNTVARNTYRNREWGQEETHQTSFPFRQGQYFDLCIFCTEDSFRISVNNWHFTTFLYRFKNIEEFDTLEVTGDVRLVHVRIK